MSPSKLESKPELENAIRRALVEVYTLLEAGRPPTDATQALDDRIIPNISLVGFDTAANDSVSLVFPDEQTRQDILDSTVEAKALVEVLEVQTESETEQSPESTDLASVEATPVEDLTSESDDNDMDNVPGTVQDIQGDDTWKSITFTDAHIKFAVRIHIPIHTTPIPPNPPSLLYLHTYVHTNQINPRSSNAPCN